MNPKIQSCMKKNVQLWFKISWKYFFLSNNRIDEKSGTNYGFIGKSALSMSLAHPPSKLVHWCKITKTRIFCPGVPLISSVCLQNTPWSIKQFIQCALLFYCDKVAILYGLNFVCRCPCRCQYWVKGTNKKH